MSEHLTYRIVGTSFGHVAYVRSPLGIRWLHFGEPTADAALARVLETFGAIPEAFASDGDLPDRLQRYFAGEPVAFPDPVDPLGATPFRQAVWDATRAIPRGEQRSYGWVAAQTGKPGAARATGQALGANPVPIIVPCHRVVGSDGELCGFSGGGIAVKARLLDLERASVPLLR